MAKKVGILSLGCARNLVDSEVISGVLKEKNYEILDLGSFENSLEQAGEVDIALVNTCAFIKEAKEESIRSILDLIELKKEGKLKKIIVAGCLSQRYKDELFRQLPEIDAFLGIVSLNHSSKRFRLTPAHYAYVKICEGCINHCSFSTIPSIKTKFRSRIRESIISEIRDLDKGPCREVNIIGQDITAYGWDLYRESRLTVLIEELLENSSKIDWFRLLYLSPLRLSDGLLRLIANHNRIAKYIDLPLQHINDRILKSMQRNIDSAQIRKLIGKIRRISLPLAIRTTLIVGFPGETEKEFNELLEFVKEVKFERLGLFMYSSEEGTKAFGFPAQVPQKIKEERYNIIMSCQQDIAREVNERWQDKVLKVLIEARQEDGVYLGRTQYDAPEVDGSVFVKSVKELPVGNFIDARVIDTLAYDLVAQAV
ncbi:MAG: MiaB/RimO family radical SAM methylthiotransferase [Candidatus Omnitrophica bacterium]|nr:MiaB/RimO family radical SAM methylthiotransferase [Candidatus Omnitrophota bacterium]